MRRDLSRLYRKMDNSTQIQDVALRLLTRREHSEFDLIRKLKLRGFETQDIKPIIEQLKVKNFLSNERFAENYIRMRVRLGFGPVKIKQELLGHQLDETLIEEYLTNDQNQWIDLAETVRKKKFGAAKPVDYAAYTKQARFLQYRGFPLEFIQDIFHNL